MLSEDKKIHLTKKNELVHRVMNKAFIRNYHITLFCIIFVHFF